MTIAHQHPASIALNEITPVSVDFSDSPMKTGEINLRTKFFVLGNDKVATPFFNHFLSPYREEESSVFCVDTDGFFRESFQQLGAEMIRYSTDRPLGFNLFLPVEIDLVSREERQLRILMALWKPHLDWFSNRQNEGSPGYLEQQIMIYAVRGYNRLWDDCPDIVIGFNSFYEYLKGDFQAFLNDHPRFASVNYDSLLEALLPYYKGGELAHLLNADDPVQFKQAEEIYHIDLSELRHQPDLMNLVARIIFETIAPELKIRQYVRKLILFNMTTSQLTNDHGWETHRQLIKDCRVQFGECWMVTKAADLTEKIGLGLLENPFMGCFQTAFLIHPAALGTSTNINNCLQLLSNLVDCKPVTIDAMEGMLTQSHRIGLYSLTQKQVRTFLLPINA